MCVKRCAGGGAGGQPKRSKACVRVELLRIMPHEIVEMILMFSIRTHLDLSILMSCCTTFRKLLRVNQVWKRLLRFCFECQRGFIIAVPLKCMFDEMSER